MLVLIIVIAAVVVLAISGFVVTGLRRGRPTPTIDRATDSPAVEAPPVG